MTHKIMKNFTVSPSNSNHQSGKRLNEVYDIKSRKKRKGFSSVLYYEKELSTGKLSPEVPEVFIRASDIYKHAELDSPDVAYTQKGTSRNKLKLNYKPREIEKPNSLQEFEEFKTRKFGRTQDRKSKLSNKQITTINLNIFSSESPSGKDENSAQKPQRPQSETFSVLINNEEAVELSSPAVSAKINSQPATTMISKYIHNSAFPHSKSNIHKKVSLGSFSILAASKLNCTRKFEEKEFKLLYIIKQS